MIEKISTENFDEVINTQTNPYFLKFGSKTCGPCNTMKPVLEALAKNNPNYKVFEIDTDESADLAQKFEIRAVPTIHICEGREILYSFYGLTPLRDLEYAITNIQDPYFREHGEFQIKHITNKSKNYTFEFIVFGLIVVICFVLFVLL